VAVPVYERAETALASIHFWEYALLGCRMRKSKVAGRMETDRNPNVASALKNVMRSAGARVMILPLSGMAVLLSTKIMTANYGVESYALFALVASLPFLVPVADLGMGAAVTNAAAALPDCLDNFKSVFAKANRILWSMAFLVIAIANILAFFGVWSLILQIPDSVTLNWSVGAAVSLFALSVPGSLGARVLLGMRRNALVVLVQGLSSLVSLAVVGIAVVLGSPLDLVIAVSTLGMCVTAWVLRIYSRRVIATSVSNTPVRQGSRRAPGSSNLIQTAMPMLIISIALPLSFQTGRLVLSWVVDLGAVAVYSAAAMVFLPVLSVVSMAGRSLWGDFARGRHGGEQMWSLFAWANVLCLGLGVAGAVSFAILGPFIARWGTNGTVDTPFALFLCFAFVILLQAVQQPSGMYLTDITGLRFQAFTTVISGIAGLLASVFLSQRYGVVGPVIATALTTSTLHVVPCFCYSIIRLKSAKEVQ
jgi:O-antigen/teichoic acid export membrane protein